MKYTKEVLTEAVMNCTSMRGVIRYLGVAESGGLHQHLSRKCVKWSIDTSHFLGKASARGAMSSKRVTSEVVFNTYDRLNGSREKTYLLKRVLLDSGVKYACKLCGITSWDNKELTLQIDHINGDWKDNRKQNLRFLCPNCHTQCDTYGNKKRAQ